MHSSISQERGIAALTEKDLCIYSVGISTAGHAEIQMALLDPRRRIVATTIDPKGVEFARGEIEKAGLGESVVVKREDVSEPLPYPAGHFDFVYARLVLHYLPREALDRALRELNRVLKREGRLFVVVRSVEGTEARDPNAVLDPETGMTSYLSRGMHFTRYFHTKQSISKHLIDAGFAIESVAAYEEHLCMDFERSFPASEPDCLIEILAKSAK